MPKIIATVGLPASGKSTWAKEQMSKDHNIKRVNKDDLRNMLDNSRWSKLNENFVLKVRDFVVLEALKNGNNVIVDDTNLHPKHLEKFREIAKDYKSELEVVDHFLEISPQECIKRDLKRPNSVGPDVIWQMYNEFLKPIPSPIVQNKDLPKAVIFDMDGTLALMKNRTPYQWDKVETDELNPAVFEVYKMYKNNGYKIIILTARDGICQTQSKNWLAKNQIQWDYFDIRPVKNIQKDNVVKADMLEKIIQQYYVEVVYDDRDQVVKMWREKGLPCFQVAEGNF